jgi:hypothetical protein
MQLPTAAVVTVPTHDEGPFATLTPEETELQQALEEADREERIAAGELFSRLQRVG